MLGARSAEVAALVAARDAGGPFRSLSDLASRAGAGRAILDRLAWAGACDALAAADVAAEAGARGSAGAPADGASARARRVRLARAADRPVAARGGRARRAAQGRHAARAAARAARARPALDPLAAWDAMVADYATTGLTLGPHPVELLRPELPAGAVSTARPGDAARTTRR